jgi:hypothetical protein
MVYKITFAFSLALAALAPSLGAQSRTTEPPQPGQSAPPSQSQLPNTVSAPSFTVADKFNYTVVQTFGLRGFAGAAISAAIGQADNSPHEWGQGLQGYAERYGSGFAGNLSRQTFAFALESAFHEDPRYFPSNDKRFKQRVLNAVKQVFICETDSGGTEFAYARVFSNFGAGQFVNVWQPKSTGTVGHGVERGLIGLGADAAYNFMQEFIPFTRPISLRHRH